MKVMGMASRKASGKVLGKLVGMGKWSERDGEGCEGCEGCEDKGESKGCEGCEGCEDCEDCEEKSEGEKRGIHLCD
jgi:hypothetical protein